MKDNKFTLQFEKEQPFSFFSKYKGMLVDDTGYHVTVHGGYAILIESESTIGCGTAHNRYPWIYTFEVR